MTLSKPFYENNHLTRIKLPKNLYTEDSTLPLPSEGLVLSSGVSQARNDEQKRKLSIK